MNSLSKKQAAQVIAYGEVFGVPARFYRIVNPRKIFPKSLEEDYDYYREFYHFMEKGMKKAFYEDVQEFSGQLRRNERPKWVLDLEARYGIKVPEYDFYLTWEKEWRKRDE